jgi:hypothetical protein
MKSGGFAKQLDRRGLSSVRGTGGIRMREGIRLQIGSTNSGRSGSDSEKLLKKEVCERVFGGAATPATSATAIEPFAGADMPNHRLAEIEEELATVQEAPG